MVLASYRSTERSLQQSAVLDVTLWRLAQAVYRRAVAVGTELAGAAWTGAESPLTAPGEGTAAGARDGVPVRGPPMSAETARAP